MKIHRTILLMVLLVLAMMSLILAVACRHREEAGGVEVAVDEMADEMVADYYFVDHTAETGLDFVHFNGMRGDFSIVEEMGSGGALFDYDNDGDLDLYLVQGGCLDATNRRVSDRLYRNDLQMAGGGAGPLNWTEVTVESGLAEIARSYGMGVATGDYDNDGWVDLYVTAYGANQMLRNQGDGTFRDVTSETGTQDERFSVPALFFDYDNDGWLDLWVGNYVDYPERDPPVCFDAAGVRDYCGPDAYESQSDRLWRNRRDGGFEDVTTESGLAATHGPALGAVAADFDGDGYDDIFVANDGRPNFLWMRRGEGFVDEALLAGVALNADGQAEASMGVGVADFDGDGALDLFLTHFITESNTLYLGDGRGLFRDATAASGLGPPSRIHTSFGTAAVDYDNDGLEDLPIVNGAVNRLEHLARAGDPYPMHQPNQLFRNLGDGRFEDVTDRAGPVLGQSEVSRGAVFGDLDNDGDLDMVVVNNNGPARIVLNQVGQHRHWLGLRLVGGPGQPRDLYGARVEVLRKARPNLLRRIRTDGGYASAHDPRIVFGLGNDPRIDAVRIVSPGGASRDITELVTVGRYQTVHVE